MMDNTLLETVSGASGILRLPTHIIYNIPYLIDHTSGQLSVNVDQQARPYDYVYHLLRFRVHHPHRMKRRCDANVQDH